MIKEKIKVLLTQSSLFLLLLMTATAFGQSPRATLSGVVKTQRDEVVSTATIIIKNNATGQTRELKTDNEGRYLFNLLEPGSYEFRAQANGFKVLIQRNLILDVGGTIVNNVTMEVGGISEQSTVEITNPMSDRANTDINRVVGESEIQGLPNIGRNFVDFVKLSSEVATGRENATAGVFKEPDIGVGSIGVPRLSFGGQIELATLIQVDGADNIQTFTGLNRATPSQEAVAEFRVLNSTYSAEYGRALGGFVNIITRSGSNDLHGSAYYFGTNDAIDATSILNTPGAHALRQNQFGTTLGGPIQKDKTFYFVNYEGQRRDQSNTFPLVVQNNIAGLNAVASRFNFAPETLNQPRSSNYDQGLFKIDRVIGQSALSLRYNTLIADTLNFQGPGYLGSTSSSARNNHINDQSLVLTGATVLSPRASNEARLQFARRSFDFPSTNFQPTFEVSDLIAMGRDVADEDYYQEDRIQASDSFSYTVGAHQFKAGLDYNYYHDESLWNLFFPARVIFPSLQALLSFSPTTVGNGATSGPAVFWYPQLVGAPAGYQVPVPFSQTLPNAYANDTGFSLNHQVGGVFFQDQWKVTPKLTLNYGLRYDIEGYPKKFVNSRDTNNVAPRIGLAYNWNPKGVIRAGFGLYYDRLAQSIGQIFNTVEYNNRGNLPNSSVLFPGVASFNGRFQQTIVVGPAATAAAQTFLATGQTPMGGIPTLNDTIDGTLKTPYSEQASLQLSQELPFGLAITVGYLYVHSVDLTGRTANLNAIATPVPAGLFPVAAPGQPYFGARTFPELGDTFFLTNPGGSTYNGGTVEVQRRFGSGMGIHGSYTFSKTMSDGGVDSLSSLANFPQSPGIMERALSAQDVRHRGTITILEEIPKSVPLARYFTLSSLISVESGRPLTIFDGYDANADGNPLSDRPGTLGRNTLITPTTASVDFRIGRPVRFTERLVSDFTVDFFNLLNRVNIRNVNSVYGSADLSMPPIASFGTPTDVLNPRQIQFGMKLKF